RCALRQGERDACNELAGRRSSILLRGGRQTQGDEGVFARGFVTSCLRRMNGGALRILDGIGLRRCRRNAAKDQQCKKRDAPHENHGYFTWAQPKGWRLEAAPTISLSV